jgi:hypothetical protein
LKKLTLLFCYKNVYLKNISKPVRANSSQDPISKKPFIKKGLVEWLNMLSPEFKTQYCQKKKRKKKKECL